MVVVLANRSKRIFREAGGMVYIARDTYRFWEGFMKMGIKLAEVLGDPGTLFSEREWVVIFVESVLSGSGELTEEDRELAVELLLKYEGSWNGLTEVEQGLLDQLRDS